MKSKNLLKTLLKHKLGLGGGQQGQTEGKYLSSLGNSCLPLASIFQASHYSRYNVPSSSHCLDSPRGPGLSQLPLHPLISPCTFSMKHPHQGYQYLPGSGCNTLLIFTCFFESIASSVSRLSFVKCKSDHFTFKPSNIFPSQ